MKKILLSLGMLTFVTAAAVGGTGAFFSDEEVSEDNVFTAGELTLTANTITHQFNGDATTGQQPGFNANGFSFELDDLKPSDEGVITYDLTNGSNDATVCVMVEETGNHDNGVNGPESDAGDTTGGSGGGELGTFLSLSVEGATGSLAALSGTWFDLGTVVGGDPVTSDIDYCFGEIDGSGACVPNESLSYNLAQTDSLNADVTFYAEQTRGNDFTCQDLNDANRTTVGATLFSYSEPAPAQCDLTVDETVSPDTTTEFSTLAAAEAVATTGQTICVDTGTYEENVTIDVENLTVLGLNDPKGASKATIDGLLTVDVDGVTISGLEMTNPDAASVVLVRDVDDTEISDNSVVNVGTTVSTGGVQAIYFVGSGSSAGSDGLTITGNTIEGVGSESLAFTSGGSSAKGIYIGDSNDTGVVTGVVITDNTISDVKASDETFANGGRGAYSILLNYGVNSTGSIDGALISDNTLSDNEGWWARGVGLETNTPNTVVTRNDIFDIVSPQGASDGVHFEGNPGGSSVVINENNFAATVGFGVSLNLPANQPAIAVDAEDNWWGDLDPSDDVLENAGTIDFTPFETAAYPTN